MKKKNLIIGIIMLMTLAGIAYAFDAIFYQDILPDDGITWVIGEENLTFLVNASSLGTRRIINISVWSNDTGTWAQRAWNRTNGTNTLTTLNTSNAGGQVNFTFSPKQLGFDLDDNKEIIWGVQVYDNTSNSTWTSNFTIYSELEWNWTQMDVVSRTYNNGTRSGINGTSLSNSTNASMYVRVNISGYGVPVGYNYECHLYTNASNAANDTWSEKGAFSVVDDFNSTYYYAYTFPDNNITKYNVYCTEVANPNVWGWGPANKTIRIQSEKTTAAIVFNSTIGDFTNKINNTINITCTGSSILNASLWINDSRNITNSTIVSGFNTKIGYFSILALGKRTGGANYSFTAECCDSTDRCVNSTPTVTVFDTKPPALNTTVTTHLNRTLKDCDIFGYSWNSTETLASSTVAYSVSGNASPSTWKTQTTTSKGRMRVHNITFGPLTEITYTANYTMVDLAGNENSTTTLESFVMPLSVCSGWSVYTVYEHTNLTNLESSIGVSDYLYWWNNTGQSWVFKTNGTQAADKQELHKGDVLWIYNTKNGSWYRNNTVPVGTWKNDLNVNLTNGSNWLGQVGKIISFGNWSHIQIMNETSGNRTNESGQHQIDDFAAWNNTGKNWVGHNYNMSINNNTRIGINSNTSLDAVWLWSRNYQITYNGSFVNATWS